MSICTKASFNTSNCGIVELALLLIREQLVKEVSGFESVLYNPEGGDGPTTSLEAATEEEENCSAVIMV